MGATAKKARAKTSNERIKVSKNFYLDEFVSMELYYKYGEKCRWFIDPRIILIAQEIRDIFGKPCIINNWWHGGSYNESGHRLPWTSTGASLSQHKRGAAIDIKIVGMRDYDKIRDVIRRNFTRLSELGLSTIERGTKSWLHCDIRDTGFPYLFEVPFYSKTKAKDKSIPMKKYVKITEGEHAGKVGIMSRELEEGFVEVLVDLDGDPNTPPIPIRVKKKFAKILYWMNMLMGFFFRWFNNRNENQNK